MDKKILMTFVCLILCGITTYEFICDGHEILASFWAVTSMMWGILFGMKLKE